LTKNERNEIISDFMELSEYIKIKKQLYHLSTDEEYGTDEDGHKITLLDLPNVESAFSNNHEDIFNFDISPEKLKKAVTYVLEYKRQKKTRDRNRALFTAFCIRKADNYIKKADEDYIKKTHDDYIKKDNDDHIQKAHVDHIQKAHDYLDELAPVLDIDLLNAYKENGIKPTQDKVYVNHSTRKDRSKKSIEANASTDLDNFLTDLNIYLKEKYPEIFS